MLFVGTLGQSAPPASTCASVTPPSSKCEQNVPAKQYTNTNEPRVGEQRSKTPQTTSCSCNEEPFHQQEYYRGATRHANTLTHSIFLSFRRQTASLHVKPVIFPAYTFPRTESLPAAANDHCGCMQLSDGLITWPHVVWLPQVREGGGGVTQCTSFKAETLTDAGSTDATALVVLFMFTEAINALRFGKVERDCRMFT